jgi:hypothetical protein
MPSISSPDHAGSELESTTNNATMKNLRIRTSGQY